ncbi:Mixed-linked glucanase xgeA [Hyphodiscus hymeniophilus]|uniref:Mixed-linked glucanase xgeA n=1 Tax=Hyphodiscus hymeniophilus TaxID=353542 RepID=A0A9P6VGJ2_9HELO|nr:Mixed-linked glucanase xgeA [Hyphodiscus hymeniophilus]
MFTRNYLGLLALCHPVAHAYSVVQKYDGNNWYNSFNFETLPDPTSGFVEYISQSEAASMDMTYTVGDQVYLGVDNKTVIDPSGTGRKSIWLESKASFYHGVLIGDFAHVSGSICGLWPAFSWTIRNDPGPYGEIDITEGFSDITYAYTTLHTQDVDGTCSFTPLPGAETGTSNQDSYDCGGQIGCSVQGPEGSYGTPMNDNGGGVWAMEWTSDHINIWFFARNAIPNDVTTEAPNPSGWGTPTANFESQNGECNIDGHFPAQTIYFDTDFCGAEAGGIAWTHYTTCAATTGVATCQDYVAANPEAFSEAYWLVNSVKVYQ